MSCKKLMAEGIGTFWIVFGGCGAAVMAGSIGTFGVAIAFGLAVLVMTYAVGHISGAHFNPAVTVGMVAGGRFDSKDAVGYVIAQVIGATVAAWLIGYMTGGANVGAVGAAGGINMHGVFVAEIVLTAVFVFIVMGVTDNGGAKGHAGLAIGLAFAAIYFLSLPLVGGGVNPARATGPALITGGWAISQLWVFWVAPLIGGIVGALAYKKMDECS